MDFHESLYWRFFLILVTFQLRLKSDQMDTSHEDLHPAWVVTPQLFFFFFVKFRYVGQEEIDSKLYPQNINPLIYTIGENTHKLCLQDR